MKTKTIFLMICYIFIIFIQPYVLADSSKQELRFLSGDNNQLLDLERLFHSCEPEIVRNQGEGDYCNANEQKCCKIDLECADGVCRWKNDV